MSVRKRTWRDKHGRQHTRWMIHVEHTWPDGRKQSIRKVSPVQTRRGAEAYEREVRKLLASGSWKEGERKQTPTLEGFAEEFLAYQKTLNKPSELANKEMTLRVHLLPIFGKRRLDQIDERAIDAYKVEKLEQLTRRGKPYNPNTVNKHLKLLARILRVARKWRLDLDVDPDSTTEALIQAAYQFELLVQGVQAERTVPALSETELGQSEKRTSRRLSTTGQGSRCQRVIIVQRSNDGALQTRLGHANAA